MLHILLLILKVTGIIIGTILGILVLLSCIVLFVPVRYEVRAVFGGSMKSVRVKIRVTWLLHLIKVSFSFWNKKISWKARIAFKTIGGGQAVNGKEEKKENEVEDHDEKLEAIVEQEETVEKQEEMEKIPQSGGGEPESIFEEMEEEFPSHEEEKEEFWEDSETVEKMEAGSHFWQKILEIVRKITGKICSLYHKIKCTIEIFCGKIRMLSEKKDKLTEFLTSEVHRQAFFKVKDEGLKLLLRLRPKIVQADIRYGFDDPCITGQVLAGLGILYPFLGEHVNVRPDFEHKVLEGRMYVKGRVRMFHIARLLWSLLWCKNVRMTYRHVREFEL